MMIKNCKYCNETMNVKKADHDRGWGIFCSKSCKAKWQTSKTGIAGPHYKAEGKTVNQMKNGNYAKSKFSGRHSTPKNGTGIFRNGHRVTCDTCGQWATNGVKSIMSDHPIDPVHGYRIEWSCDEHFDDTHPFDGI